MALKVSTSGQLVFFSQVFGPHHHLVVKRIPAMLAAGATFEVGLYTVKAKTAGGQYASVDLTVSTNALMKGLESSAVIVQNQHLIEQWIEGLHWFPVHQVEDPSPLSHHQVQVPYSVIEAAFEATPLEGHKTLSLHGVKPGKKLPVIKAVYEILGTVPLKEAGALVQKAIHALTVIKTFNTHADAEEAQFKLKAAGGIQVLLVTLGQFVTTHTEVNVGGPSTYVGGPVIPLSTFEEKPTLVDEVIDLKDAKAVGQKVHGTSKGSVYYCVAISEQGVKVAARLYQSGAISIRAEWYPTQTLTGTHAELAKLTASGLQMKSKGYGSVHFDAAGVPLQRVVGAFLTGCGVKWKDVVTNGDELVVTHG